MSNLPAFLQFAMVQPSSVSTHKNGKDHEFATNESSAKNPLAGLKNVSLEGGLAANSVNNRPAPAKSAEPALA